MPYCRSWTLNVGARFAKGRVIVFHDSDMLVPDAYAAELWHRHSEGFEVINVKRFIFYLPENGSKGIQTTRRLGFDEPPEAVVQNLEAGGSLAMDRDAFFAIGGYDEGFVGWGGEDNEFWERAQTRQVWPYGYLPIVHLWHPAQPRKQDPSHPNSGLQAERSAQDPRQRIRELAARPFGDPARLSVDWPRPEAS
jgi:GT2 family glycosyltransferase